MSYYPNPNHPLRNLIVEQPSQKDKKILLLLIILGYCSSIAFLIWYFNFHEAGHPLLFLPFTFSVLFIVSRIFFEWYNFLGIDVPRKPALTKPFIVDILTTFCPGEPYKMVETTLLAAKNITYPHKTIYLCDEANDDRLRKFCKEHGIVHVTRTDKSNAKAGNINNALKQATGELCVIMDPDHVPVPEFLDRTVAYFQDEKVGYVQCCQGYYNQDEGPVALGACEQTYHFYGPQMMGMGTYGTAQAIGANCTFRRAALDSIGGHSAGLTEDMHTSMNLQAKGWKAVYIPEMLSRGLVPADIVAYYKQQLKWSRGSFEMLFEKYPQLFSQFTWRQKLHHLMTPLFYLNGLSSLFFLLIPILSLFLSDVPVHIDFIKFMTYFIPVIGFQMIIRQYVQRWLYKPQERGFHLTGGILMVGTWWIYTLGFLYSIVRKKVPYLPTPKEGQKKNFFLLLLPNIVIILASFVSIGYGLSKDWSSFSWLMSGFAGINILLLIYFCLMCQQRWLLQLKGFFKSKDLLYELGHGFKISTFRYSQVTFFSLRKYAASLALIVFALTLTNNIALEKETTTIEEETKGKKLHYGGYWIGYAHCDGSGCTSAPSIGNSFKTSLSEYGISLNISSTTNHNHYREALEKINPGLLPVLQITYLSKNATTQDILKQINLGLADAAFDSLLQAIEETDRTYFINLIANPLQHNFNSEEETAYKTAWIRLTSLVHKRGLSNNVLLFAVDSPKKLDMLFPGSEYVDWVLVKVNKNSHPDDYHASLSQLKKPLMLQVEAENETQLVTYLEKAAWKKHCAGLLIYNLSSAKEEQNLATYLRSSIGTETLLTGVVHVVDTTTSKPTPSPLLAGKEGTFYLTRNNQPFFVKGIAYNVAHDWRDQDKALTRKSLSKDFSKIKAMGANTIRRYGTSTYDQNILNMASEFDLAVLYGFWLEAKVDYLQDSAQLNAYENEVLTTVANFKDHPSVLAWSLGNETWSLLKYHYGKPYLGLVRKAYVDFLERLARKIKAIDPAHPVVTSMEYNDAYAIEELHQLKEFAPTLDFIGVNAYYEEQLSGLNKVMGQHFPEKPYLITEFGPRGYWHPTFSKFDQENLLIEDHDQEKARLYQDQWKNYIQPHKGQLLGAIAYSWTDRLEGTFTWYGVTDFKERKKPAYYALKNIWQGTLEKPSLVQAGIQSSDEVFYPGGKYRFEASTNTQGDYQYEWYLKKDVYLKDVLKGIDPSSNGKSVEITIPTEPAEYRLYLHVTDGNGNVVTASKGIKSDFSFMERLTP